MRLTSHIFGTDQGDAISRVQHAATQVEPGVEGEGFDEACGQLSGAKGKGNAQQPQKQQVPKVHGQAQRCRWR
eukprot:9598614-Lingulodinium_polyedra.AAC.1